MKKITRKARRSIPRNDAKVARQFVRAAHDLEETYLNPAKQAGEYIAARLLASAPSIMRRVFTDHVSNESPASQHWKTAWDGLQNALNARVDEPAVAEALSAIDAAHGEALAETEEMAFHAAFRLASGLRGGAR